LKFELLARNTRPSESAYASANIAKTRPA